MGDDGADLERLLQNLRRVLNAFSTRHPWKQTRSQSRWLWSRNLATKFLIYFQNVHKAA